MAEIRKRQAVIVIWNHYKKKTSIVGSAVACSKNAMGTYNNLKKEMTEEDPQQFRIFAWMSVSNLGNLLRGIVFFNPVFKAQKRYIPYIFHGFKLTD